MNILGAFHTFIICILAGVKTYGGNFIFTILPLNAGTPGVRLNNNCRKCKLLQLTWTHLVYNVTTSRQLPDQINTEVIGNLQLIRDAASTNPLFQVFDSIAPPAPAGADQMFYSRGQYYFENVTFYNGLNLNFTYNNLSGVNTYDISISLIVKLLQE